VSEAVMNDYQYSYLEPVLSVYGAICLM